jgi:hypothetical protein
MKKVLTVMLAMAVMALTYGLKFAAAEAPVAGGVVPWRSGQ